MSDLEAINKIVNAGTENEMVDFKREFYKRLSNSDVAKDVAAFANVLGKSDKYVIFGSRHPSGYSGFYSNRPSQKD